MAGSQAGGGGPGISQGMSRPRKSLDVLGRLKGTPIGVLHWHWNCHNSLGLHRGSKRWCEWLPDVVLGPGALEKPGWEFRV